MSGPLTDVEGATALPGRPSVGGLRGHVGAPHGCRGRHGFAGASERWGFEGPCRGPSRMSRAPRLCRGVRALGVWGPFRGPHLDGRLAYERGRAHVAGVVHGERPGAV